MMTSFGSERACPESIDDVRPDAMFEEFELLLQMFKNLVTTWTLHIGTSMTTLVSWLKL